MDAVNQQLDTYEVIAEQFSVHVSYVYKLPRQRPETGDLAPLPRGGGAAPKLGEGQLLMLV